MQLFFYNLIVNNHNNKMSQNISDISSLNNSISNFLLNTNVEISFSNFFVAMLLSTFSAIIIKYTYIKVSLTINDKEHFSETFVPLAIITTLVITVIKFSLALSLGLVGALSIVRFRAAIKEPEELVFFIFNYFYWVSKWSQSIFIVNFFYNLNCINIVYKKLFL